MTRKNETKFHCYVIMMTMPMPMLMIGLQETIAQALHNGQAGHLAEPQADGAAAPPYGPQIHALIIPNLTSQQAF